MHDIHEWNIKLYDGKNGNWGAEEFWEELNIKSWPKFKDECVYHIPGVWAPEVKKLVLGIQKELGERVKFCQIKEKFCELVIYYQTETEEDRSKVSKLIRQAKLNLIKQGIHPPTIKENEDD